MKSVDMCKLRKAVYNYANDSSTLNEQKLAQQKDYCIIEHGKRDTQRTIALALTMFKKHE